MRFLWLIYHSFINILLLADNDSIFMYFRFLISPDKKAFCRSVYNVIDVIAITPGMAMFAIEMSGLNSWANRHFYNLVFCLTLLGVFRIFRLIKFARHYTAMRVLLLALRASCREILLLFMLIAMGMLLFSTLVYFAEFECVDSDIDTIPYGFWWSLVTMTTVGYGDAKPKSGWGFVVGGLCALAGMLCTGLPIPIIASNFNMHFTYHRDNVRLKDRRKCAASGANSGVSSHGNQISYVTNASSDHKQEAHKTESKKRRRRRKVEVAGERPVTQPVYVKNATFLGNNIRTYTNYGNHDTSGARHVSSDDDYDDDDGGQRSQHVWRTMSPLALDQALSPGYGPKPPDSMSSSRTAYHSSVLTLVKEADVLRLSDNCGAGRTHSLSVIQRDVTTDVTTDIHS